MEANGNPVKNKNGDNPILRFSCRPAKNETGIAVIS